MGHALINYIASDFATSGRALGYVSIAGTVVSIMLAFIAIIYSFVQSITHTTSVAEIRAQVDRLLEAGEKIAQLESGLDASVRNIEQATVSLEDKIYENTHETKKLTESFIARSQITSEVQLGEPNEGSSVFASKWNMIELLNVMVFDMVELGMPLDRFEKDVLRGYAKKFYEEDKGFADFVSGSLVVQAISLSEKNVITLEVGGKGLSKAYEKAAKYDEFESWARDVMADSGKGALSEYLKFSRSLPEFS